MHYLRRRPWHLKEGALTDEGAWERFRAERRAVLRGAGVAAASLALPGCFTAPDATARPRREVQVDPHRQAIPLSEPFDDLLRNGFPADRSAAYPLDRPLTDEAVAASHNNFYEFTADKKAVWKLVGDFVPRPWAVEVRGLVHEPKTFDVDDLYKLGFEERTYRFRCVEAWAMAVPWTGVPMRRFVEACRPLSSARFVRFVSFHRPEQALGQRRERWWPWPYYEGLTLAEATHELTLLATGIYGHALPRQHGAPVRLVTPWKYGFKSIKSIVVVEFTDRLPRTFWNDLQPDEYKFEANVNPRVQHPRWAQTRERLIGTGQVRTTEWLNGYASLLGDLYPTQPETPGWDDADPPFST